MILPFFVFPPHKFYTPTKKTKKREKENITPHKKNTNTHTIGTHTKQKLQQEGGNWGVEGKKKA